jgi:type II restriction/modification system DNA methylase subunit YeeA
MTPAEFKRKWSRYQGKETSAYQEHFNDLCRLLGQPTPVEADPSGSDFFCFQKRVVKDAELFQLNETGEEAAADERGFADVWKKLCFGWEYKGKHKNLEHAYRQLQRYREALLNPPLLVVCDFERFIIRTNFNGTVQETHEFTNDQIDRPENLRTLRALFENPDYLKPQRTTAQVTETLAVTIAEVANSLQKREARELADARTRAELNFAQRKNLRIARFLNRIVFCFFAEDTGLLPKTLFSDLLKAGLDDPPRFAETLEKLFAVMATGGTFGKDRIRHFNGHLFEESSVFELTEDELRELADASLADWQFIQPSIMGTLFERALEPEQRSQLGAHYTSEADIKTLVEPVLMAPLRREWTELKAGLATDGTDDTDKRPSRRSSVARKRIEGFLARLRSVTVLDPACGSGNFLYVALQLLLDLEKEVITHAVQLGFTLVPQVTVQQLRALEINPYAFELAQVSVQIGFLQWRRDNGFDNDRSPVLQDLEGFQNQDALVHQVFKRKPKGLKEAQAEEHSEDTTQKAYVEREWPACDVIVGNPPFLGDKLMRGELGDGYVEELRRIYGDRIPGQSDLCCYWFEKARALIEKRKCRRAGLLATQAIRGGANRVVLKRIKTTGDIFYAQSDREWILAGANVHVSMVGFDDGSEKDHRLNGSPVVSIHPQLTAEAPTASSTPLERNESVCFIGTTKKAPLDLDEDRALEFLRSPNPTGRPNSDVVLPWMNGLHVTRRASRSWIIDFPMGMELACVVGYAGPFTQVEAEVKPLRIRHREPVQAKYWWRQARPCPELRSLTRKLERYCVTPRVAKHRIVAWIDSVIVPDCQLVAFAREDDYFFGVIHSRTHAVWALAQGTQLREKESGFRYTPTTCFETFPFPFTDDLSPGAAAAGPQIPGDERSDSDGGWGRVLTTRFYTVKEEPPTPSGGGTPAHPTPDQHRAAISAAAKELNELRERWLNPPEWTRTEILEFPASVDGPWARFVECGGKRSASPLSAGTQTAVAANALPAHSPIGLARYPRLVPKDAECAAELKERTLTNLYNERPAWLALAHEKLDAAVAAAYGWPADLTDDQTLERLLALNLERAAEEAAVAKAPKRRDSRAAREDELL